MYVAGVFTDEGNAVSARAGGVSGKGLCLSVSGGCYCRHTRGGWLEHRGTELVLQAGWHCGRCSCVALVHHQRGGRV